MSERQTDRQTETETETETETRRCVRICARLHLLRAHVGGAPYLSITRALSLYIYTYIQIGESTKMRLALTPPTEKAAREFQQRLHICGKA